MKWDYASITKWGISQKGPDGTDLFVKAVTDLAKRLSAEIEAGPLLNGYQESYSLLRNGDLICNCLTGGTGSADGSSQFIAANTADEVYPILQDMFQQHSVTRLDAAEDFRGDGVFEKLESMLTTICGKHKVSMSPFGEGHFRPDGTRDSTKGRSWYCGSKSSPFRIVLYEKGLEQIAKGIPADPTWARLEVRIRPSSKSKSFLGSVRLKPSDLFGMSRWGMAVGEYLGIHDLQRMRIGSVWRPNEHEQMALKIVRMFDRGLEQLLEQAGSAEAVGRLLFDVQAKAREAKAIRSKSVTFIETVTNN